MFLQLIVKELLKILAMEFSLTKGDHGVRITKSAFETIVILIIARIIGALTVKLNTYGSVLMKLIPRQDALIYNLNCAASTPSADQHTAHVINLVSS
jgi:hypothetical protein